MSFGGLPENFTGSFGPWGGSTEIDFNVMTNTYGGYSILPFSFQSSSADYELQTADFGVPYVNLYLVPRQKINTPLSSSTLQSFQAFVTWDPKAGWASQAGYSLALPSTSDFYLAFAEQFDNSLNTNTWGSVTPLDTFGWLHFENNYDGTVSLLGTFGASGVGGVYVGTSNTVPVPEPEIYAILLAGLVLLSIIARRKNSA